MSKTVEMKKRFKEKRGVALLIAVLAMLMLTLFAIGFALQTGTDIDVGRAYLEKVKTFYIAQAGFNRARTAITLGNEAAYTLDSNSSIDPVAENFGSGQFDVSATSDATTVSITSEGGIPTALTGRTKRIVQENSISRGGGPPTATASTQQTGSEASFAIDTNNGGFKYSRGTPWRSQAGAAVGQSQGAWIIIDFGTPVSFDYMIFVRDTVYTGGGGNDYPINRWSLDVCTPSDADCETTGTGWASRVTTTMSQYEPLSATGLKDTDISVYPRLGIQNYWMAVNFLKVGNASGQTVDCDNGTLPSAIVDGADHCTGVLPAGAVGVQTTRQVRITANCVTNCTSTTVFAEIDWIQFKMNGFLTYTSATPAYFSFEGTDVQGTSGLAVPKDFTER